MNRFPIFNLFLHDTNFWVTTKVGDVDHFLDGITKIMKVMLIIADAAWSLSFI